MKYFSDCAEILITAPCYLGCLCMADRFCRKYLEGPKRNELLFVVLSFSGWLFMNIVNRRYPVPHIFYAMAEHIVFGGLVLLLFRECREKKILAVSVLMIAMTLLPTFVSSFLSCLILFFKHTMRMVPNPLLSEWEGGVAGCAGYCLAMSAIYWLLGHMERVFSGRRRMWYVVLALPLIMIIIVFDVSNWGASQGIMVRSGGSMGLYYDQIFSHAEFLILTLLSMSASWFYVFGMDRICLEQEKSSRYRSQIAVYRMLAEQYRQSERLRHDMKNHVIALSALSQNKEWEKIDDYLKRMGDMALEAGGDMTGNKAVDALLYQKRKQAEEEKIGWECDVQMPKGHCVNEFDLCVLFGNLLDNALEACRRMQFHERRFIRIRAKTVKKCFLLEVKNSMDRAETYIEGWTNKDNTREHGIGLLNVGDVADKYNGAVDIEAGEGIFTISILIPLNDAAYDIKTTV